MRNYLIVKSSHFKEFPDKPLTAGTVIVVAEDDEAGIERMAQAEKALLVRELVDYVELPRERVLEDLTKAELVALAKGQGLELDAKLTKKVMIQEIEDFNE